MRGLEGVWRGASRHQSLIIYRPTSSYHHIRNSSYHHIRVMWMEGKEQCGEEVEVMMRVEQFGSHTTTE